MIQAWSQGPVHSLGCIMSLQQLCFIKSNALCLHCLSASEISQTAVRWTHIHGKHAKLAIVLSTAWAKAERFSPLQTFDTHLLLHCCCRKSESTSPATSCQQHFPFPPPPRFWLLWLPVPLTGWLSLTVPFSMAWASVPLDSFSGYGPGVHILH